MLAVSQFQATLIGAVVGGSFAILAGVIAARVEARRTEELAVALRRRERADEAMWELAHRLSEFKEALERLPLGASPERLDRLFSELTARWPFLARAVRAGAIAQGFSDVRRLAEDYLSTYMAQPNELLAAIDQLLAELQAETLGEDGH